MFDPSSLSVTAIIWSIGAAFALGALWEIVAQLKKVVALLNELCVPERMRRIEQRERPGYIGD